jgi:cyclopropane-fatty-acyl-phospholipid synthase
MDARTSQRGGDLFAGGKALRSGSGWLARAWAGGWHRVLDRIDAGLDSGAVHARLPDGSHRLLGGRAAGFEAEVEIRDWRALLRLATTGSVGWYQAWEAGEWNSPDLVALFALFSANADSLGKTARARGPWRLMARGVHWLHRNTRAGARRNIHAHYDLGNDFYAAWLGSTMTYSSAIFEDWGEPTRWRQRLDPLDFAQLAKITTIANRAATGPGDRALEIGCGWGAQAVALAGSGADVVAISLSDEQLGFCRAKTGSKARRVDFRKQDYRDIDEQFDAIVSVEMVEAVGREYWPDFFDCLARCLKPGGRAALQYIAIREATFPSYAGSADFIQVYVFPGGMLVSEAEFRRLAAERGLEWTDQVNFGLHYAETLKAWRANFDRAVEEGRLPSGFDQRFAALWRYYLMYCEGGFRGGGIDVAQVTLIKPA